MAKCVIEIEDAPGGRVKITASPSFATVCEMINSGHEPTSAHSYHMHLIRKCMEYEKASASESKILIPRITGKKN